MQDDNTSGKRTTIYVFGAAVIALVAYYVADAARRSDPLRRSRARHGEGVAQTEEGHRRR